jgi:hypothetical protein
MHTTSSFSHSFRGNTWPNSNKYGVKEAMPIKVNITFILVTGEI